MHAQFKQHDGAAWWGECVRFVCALYPLASGECFLYEWGVDDPILVGDSGSGSEHSGRKPSSPCPSTSWSALRSPAKIVDSPELR